MPAPNSEEILEKILVKRNVDRTPIDLLQNDQSSVNFPHILLKEMMRFAACSTVDG